MNDHFPLYSIQNLIHHICGNCVNLHLEMTFNGNDLHSIPCCNYRDKWEEPGGDYLLQCFFSSAPRRRLLLCLCLPPDYSVVHYTIIRSSVSWLTYIFIYKQVLSDVTSGIFGQPMLKWSKNACLALKHWLRFCCVSSYKGCDSIQNVIKKFNTKPQKWKELDFRVRNIACLFLFLDQIEISQAATS